MIKFFKNLFKPKRSESELIRELLNESGSGLIDDADFGIIEYFQPINCDDGIWQMIEKWKYSKYTNSLQFCSSSIPGNIEGPYNSARNFLLSKNNSESINALWESSDIGLSKQIERWHKRHLGKKPRELFHLSFIDINSMKNNDVFEWEIVFIPKEETVELKGDVFTSIYIKFENDKYVGTSCDT